MRKLHLLPLCLLLASINLFTTSCRTLYGNAELEASFDGTERRYDGDSYDQPYVDVEALGANLGLIWNVRLAVGSTGQNSISNNSTPQPLWYVQPYSHLQDELLSAPDNSFKSHVSFLTGLKGVLKNSKDDIDKISMTYLQVPFIGIYNYQLEKGGTIFGGLGPYVAYGIAGKIKSPNFSMGAFEKDNGGYRRFDAGLALTAGYAFKNGMRVRLGYDYGIADIDRIEADNTKNRTWSVNFAYPIKLFKRN